MSTRSRRLRPDAVRHGGVSYDDQGNYLYPEGFDPETGEWLEGYEEQRRGLGAAVRRGPRPLGGAQAAGRGCRERGDRRGGSPASYSSSCTEPADAGRRPAEGSLASDEALQALRDKLTGAAT